MVNKVIKIVTKQSIDSVLLLLLYYILITNLFSGLTLASRIANDLQHLMLSGTSVMPTIIMNK